MSDIIDLRDPKSDLNEYAVFWERIANSGVVLKNAKDEKDASNVWSHEFVRHTVIRIVKGSIPYVIGVMK